MNAFNNWLYKYRLYHLPFWIVYHFTWWSIQIGDPVAAANSILFSPTTVKFLFYVIFQAVGVYFNLYYLIPRYLERGKYFQYVTWLMLTILVTAILIIPGYYLSAWWSGLAFEQLFGLSESAYLQLFKTNSLPSTAASMTLAMSIKLTKSWLESKKRAQILAKEKLETELKFLKSQFNPHFLFNTINSIFVLIHKNPDRASESLAKFSNLMRYQLYDCNAHQIPLCREIDYLENFIELEELRQEANFELDLQVYSEIDERVTIAPFMLMPFVENAFKHVSQHQNLSNWIKIKLDVQGEQLDFAVANSFANGNQHPEQLSQYGGLGLKNVQRRLKLLYPERHQLSIRQSDDRFTVQLQVSLTQSPIPETFSIQTV